MTVTILASLFLLIILLMAFVGFTAARKQTRPSDEPHMEKCSLCCRRFNKATLVERQVGDYKLLYFCTACIGELHNEVVRKN
jgi:hypothetical protein